MAATLFDFKHGFGNKGANVSQNRNGLYELIGGIKRACQEEHATKVLPPRSPTPIFGTIVVWVAKRGGARCGARRVLMQEPSTEQAPKSTEVAIIFFLQPPPDPSPLHQISCPPSGLHPGRTLSYQNYIPFPAADARARTPQQTEHWDRVSGHELVANPSASSPPQPFVNRSATPRECGLTSSVGIPTPIYLRVVATSHNSRLHNQRIASNGILTPPYPYSQSSFPYRC